MVNLISLDKASFINEVKTISEKQKILIVVIFGTTAKSLMQFMKDEETSISYRDCKEDVLDAISSLKDITGVKINCLNG